MFDFDDKNLVILSVTLIITMVVFQESIPTESIELIKQAVTGFLGMAVGSRMKS